MKKKLAIIGIVLVFLCGVAVMSYPLISSMLSNKENINQGIQYQDIVENMSDDAIEKMFQQAEKYNNSLNKNVAIQDPFGGNCLNKVNKNYNKILNVDGKGLIGYVEIPSINVYLPIYHGTSEKVLSKGAGHVQNSSFPIGGKGTHSIISAHSSYPEKTFFNYLEDMKKGDCFYITVLNRKLKYEVDRIKVVLPEDNSDFAIIPKKDYVTLVTCTPFSVNTHRLLVRGKRVPYDYEKDKIETPEVITLDEEGMYIFGNKIPYWAVALIIAGFVITVISVLIIAIKCSRKNHGKAKTIKKSKQKLLQ